MRNINIIFLIFLSFLISYNIKAQSIFGPDTAAFKRYVKKYSNDSPQISEYLYKNNLMSIGNDGSLIKYRAFYQWNIPDIIPDNSQVDTVELFFTYHPIISNYYISVQYSNIGIDIQNPDASTMWGRSALGSSYDIGLGQGNKYGYQGTQMDTVISLFGPSSDFCKAIEDALTEDKFILGITSNSESYPYKWFIDNYSFKMRIVYSSPTKNITVDQKLSNNTRVDSVGLWNSDEGKFEKFSVPASFNWNVGSSKTLRGSQKLLSNQKYIHWEHNFQPITKVTNHKTLQIYKYSNNLTSRFNPTNPGMTIKNSLEGTSVIGGNIKFADPWYIDYADPDFGSSPRNRGMKDKGEDALQFYPRSVGNTGWQPDFTTVYPESPYPYNGVFPNQPYTGNNPVYYSVQAISPQPIPLDPPIGTRDFYFQNWYGTSVSFQNSESATTGVVFNSGDATVNANMKGQGLSDDENAYSSNNQRKFVRTAEGYLHNVYESMGHVWYELSEDNGETWTLKNQHQPLDIGGGESPSITDVSINGSHNYVVIVYQQAEEGTGYPYSIRAAVFGGNDSYPLRQTESIYSSGYQYTHNDATPVIAGYPAVDVDGLDIVWHTSSGLLFQRASLGLDINQPFNKIGDPITISGTNSASINPSLATYRLNNTGHFYLVWEENNSIKYTSLYGAESGSVQTISGNDGYAYNTNPSHIVLDDSISRVCWKGSRYAPVSIGHKLNGSNLETRVIFRGVNYNHFWSFGQNVSAPTINKAYNQGYYALLWNQDENSTYFCDNSLGTPRSISDMPGKNVQLSNGTDKDHMYAEELNTSSLPYYFKTTDPIGSYYTAQKSAGYEFSGGREGIIAKDTAQFYFTVGDISVDDQTIGFIEIPDSIVFNSKEVLNQYLVSNPFELTDNSNFLYSIQYGITDSSAAVELLENSGKFVSFKLQLVDNQTLEVLGTFDEVTYDQSNIYQYSSISYEVSTQGIGNREVYLRLVTDDNFDSDYSLGEIFSAEDVLQKTVHKTVNYDGINEVKSYDLSQNYPNPFNPTTTINYQLPQNGFVTLKVYDILGKEVAILVNEQKNQGRYSIQFDASNLSSGVYIYQFHVNDYVVSRKMLLIK